MSNHNTHHDSHHGGEKFAPLSDNNNNVNLTSAFSYIGMLAIGLFCVVLFVVSNGGYLNNEEQTEWRVANGATCKDSDENKFLKTSAEASESKEEMKVEEGSSTEMKTEGKKADESADMKSLLLLPNTKSTEKKAENAKVEDTKSVKKH